MNALARVAHDPGSTSDLVDPHATRGEWHTELALHAQALRITDPVPMMLVQLQSVPGLKDHISVLYTVLSELYSNALEHGVLGLSSSMAAGLDGLEHYIAAREQGLAEIREGWVKMSVKCKQWESGGELLIDVRDSGKGFNWHALRSVAAGEPHNRGMQLLKGLCAAVGFKGKGNHAYAIYRWGAPQALSDTRQEFGRATPLHA